MKNRIFDWLSTAILVWWAAYLSVRLFFPKRMGFPFTILDPLTIMMPILLGVAERILRVEYPQEEKSDKYMFNLLLYLPFVIAILRFMKIL